MDKIKYHKQLTDSIHETYLAKNADYGDSFAESFKEFGVVAALVRMSDKWNRLKNLAKGNEAQVKGESIRDTLLDLSNYALLTVMELDAEKGISNNKAFEEKLKVKITDVEEECEELPFTPISEEEQEIILDNVVKVEGDAEYIVPEKWLERYGSNKIGSMIAFRNAGWSQRKIADEFQTHQRYLSDLFREIERI